MVWIQGQRTLIEKDYWIFIAKDHWIFNWLKVSLHSEDGFRTGCWNISRKLFCFGLMKNAQ